MAIVGFQHINTRSTDVERTRAFYERILGLRVGDRPPLASTGYWLYAGDEPIVHLIQRPAGEPGDAGGGNFDHVAFSCSDLDRIRAALRAAEVPFVKLSLHATERFSCVCRTRTGSTSS